MVLVGDSYREFYAQFNTLHLSVNAKINDLSATLDKIEEEWNVVYPEEPFEVNFMDETIKQFYNKERKTSTLLAWATGLSILISCLGLLGLVVYTTERRTREIGIRKVLGSSVLQLNILLCRDFLKLVGIAFIIAVPVAWYGLNKWLETFAFKTDLSWWVFALSGFFMSVLAFLIMSIKTIAEANTNPVKSLRTE
jgi:ABC-type antimicrobial peptide transport system permease subunit